MLDIFIQQYIEEYSGHKAGRWCCQDGCFYKGIADLYTATRDQWYLDQLIQHINKQIQPDGQIKGYDLATYRLDNLNAGKALFLLYEKTNDVRYLIALRKLRKQMQTHPRTKSENFCYENNALNQVRLEGLYMGLPMLAQYNLVFENGQELETVRQQFFNARSLMFDSKKGLYHYGYDESRQSKWADKNSGLSSSFWSQAMGWYIMALVDVCDIIGQQHRDFIFYARLIKEFAENLLLWQQPVGLWTQIIDQPEREGNYLETSASTMFAYAFLKAKRLNILTDQHSQAGRMAFDGILENRLKLKNDTWQLEGICTATELNDSDGGFDDLVKAPVVANDPMGVGPFFMLMAELLRQESVQTNENYNQNKVGSLSS